jgi:hypothetical protein
MRSRRPWPSESSQSTLVIPCTENTGQLQLDAAPTQRICPGMAKIGGEKIEQYQWIMQLSRVHTADCVMAETKKEVVAAFDAFVETWGVKYDKAVERGSRRAARLLLAEAAERSWPNQLPKIILSIKFIDGIEVVRSQAQTAAADSSEHTNLRDEHQPVAQSVSHLSCNAALRVTGPTAWHGFRVRIRTRTGRCLHKMHNGDEANSGEEARCSLRPASLPIGRPRKKFCSQRRLL